MAGVWVVALVAGLIAFRTDLLKMNVAALNKDRETLSSQNKTLLARQAAVCEKS